MVMFALAVCSNRVNGAIFPNSGPMTPGPRATLRGGIALAPAQAPLAVKRAIWAANQLRSKPYRYGGGHASFHDSGYDCSGMLSYALAGAGLISSPMSSSDFRRYGQRGKGRWITLYTRNGHTFAVIADLRLDTTPGDSPGIAGRGAGNRPFGVRLDLRPVIRWDSERPGFTFLTE